MPGKSFARNQSWATTTSNEKNPSSLSSSQCWYKNRSHLPRQLQHPNGKLKATRSQENLLDGRPSRTTSLLRTGARLKHFGSTSVLFRPVSDGSNGAQATYLPHCSSEGVLPVARDTLEMSPPVAKISTGGKNETGTDQILNQDANLNSLKPSLGVTREDCRPNVPPKPRLNIFQLHNKKHKASRIPGPKYIGHQSPPQVETCAKQTIVMKPKHVGSSQFQSFNLSNTSDNGVFNYCQTQDNESNEVKGILVIQAAISNSSNNIDSENSENQFSSKYGNKSDAEKNEIFHESSQDQVNETEISSDGENHVLIFNKTCVNMNVSDDKLPPHAKFESNDEISCLGGSRDDEAWEKAEQKVNNVTTGEPAKTSAAAGNSLMHGDTLVDSVSWTVRETAEEKSHQGRAGDDGLKVMNNLTSLQREKVTDKANTLPPPAATPLASRILSTVVKSASLDNYYKSRRKVKSGGGGDLGPGEKLFQRLTSITRSFHSQDERCVSTTKLTPHLTSKQDFFQNIKQEADRRSIPNHKIWTHGQHLAVPSLALQHRIFHKKRKIYHDKSTKIIKKSMSFSDAQTIAKAVLEGNMNLIDNLYPHFPLSNPVYNVIDRGANKSETETKLDILKQRVKVNKKVVGGESKDSDPGFDSVHSELYTHNSSLEDVRCSLLSVPAPCTTVVNIGQQIIKTVEVPVLPIVTLPLNLPFESDGKRISHVDLDTFTAIPIQRISGNSGINENSSHKPVNTPVDFYCPQEPSPVISPLGSTNRPVVSSRQNSKSSIIQTSDHVVLVECNTPVSTRQQHPYKSILSTAEINISQAESILSLLGHERKDHSSSYDKEQESDGEPSSLGSDIEINIRKLERTQARINAALETFRAVKSLSQDASEVDGDIKTRVTQPQTESDPWEQVSPVNKCGQSDEVGRQVVRRHSFNNLGRQEKEQDDKRTTASWYQQDICQDSDSGTVRLSEDGYFSDSDTSVLPFKNRIRGLLGSFGKGKKKSKQSMNQNRQVSQTSEGSSDVLSDRDSISIGHLTDLVQNLTANKFVAGSSAIEEGNAEDLETMHQLPEVLLRHQSLITNRKQAVLSQNNSNSDTFSSLSTTQSFAASSSNRNSIISEQSFSSESIENSTSERNDGVVGDRKNNIYPSIQTLSPVNQKERKILYIANEIMTSERVYVDVLRLLNIQFREFVGQARAESKSGILPNQVFVKLFSNLSELLMLNEDLLRDFEERIEKWDQLKKIADVIVRKGPYLKLYTVYIKDFSAMNFHFDESCQRYPKFNKLVKEFEKLPICQNLKLKHFMLKPVQRLPQYKLLLEDYLKHLDPDGVDFDDTTNALRIVSGAAEHANDTVKQGDKFQRMLRLQARLCDWEIIRPGRELLREGELMKISRKGLTARYFVLLSDCLLYSTYQGTLSGENTNLKVSYTILLNQLQIHVPKLEDFQTEFSITSNVRSYTLRAKDVKERNEWLESLNSAIEDYRSRKATFSTQQVDGLGEISSNVGDSAPVWIPDQRVTMCQACSAEFTLVIRRHHCRGCGKVVCSQCGANKAPLRYRLFESARVCDVCYEALEKEHGANEDLGPRFKRREMSRSVGRYVPQRLKLSASGLELGEVQMVGYLRQRTGGLGRWKKNWFVLRDKVLYTYRASEDTVATDTLPVLGWQLDLVQGEQGMFILSHQGSEEEMFSAESINIAEKWIRAIREAIILDQS